VTAAEMQNIAMKLSGTLYVRYAIHRKTMLLECLGPNRQPQRVLPLERLGFVWDADLGLHWIVRTHEKERACEGKRSEKL
jgi:hypothetical protein